MVRSIATKLVYCCHPEKPSQNSENEQNSVSLEVLLVKVCHKKRKVKWNITESITLALLCNRTRFFNCLWSFSFRMSAALLSKCLQVKSRCLWILTVTKPNLVRFPPYWSPATSLSLATATWSSRIPSCSECRVWWGGILIVWWMARPMRTLVRSWPEGLVLGWIKKRVLRTGRH